MGWILSSLISGLIVGAIARLLMPGRDSMGCLMTALLGIGGSFIGGFISTLIWGGGGRHFYGIRPGGFLLSIIGAMVLLIIGRMLRSKN